MDYAIPWCVCSGNCKFLFSLNLHLRVGFLGCSATEHPYPLGMTVENVNAHRTPGIFIATPPRYKGTALPAAYTPAHEWDRVNRPQMKEDNRMSPKIRKLSKFVLEIDWKYRRAMFQETLLSVGRSVWELVLRSRCLRLPFINSSMMNVGWCCN